jgi:hypothetical protein
MGEEPAMRSRRWKWGVLAAAGSIADVAMLLLFRSIPIAAGTATAAVFGIIILKHFALAIALGSPLAAIFKGVKPNIRRYCPFATP